MTTIDNPTTENLELPKAMTRILDLTDAIVIISGPDYSGKSTTMRLLEEDLRKKHPLGDHPLSMGVINVDFKNANVSNDGDTASFDSFQAVPESINGTETVSEYNNKLQNKAFRTIDRMEPIVVMIDNIPKEFMEGAAKLAFWGRLVIVSIHADSAQEALDIFTEEALRSDMVSLTDLEDTIYASICQHAVKDAETGKVSIETETILPWHGAN